MKPKPFSQLGGSWYALHFRFALFLFFTWRCFSVGRGLARRINCGVAFQSGVGFVAGVAVHSGVAFLGGVDFVAGIAAVVFWSDTPFCYPFSLHFFLSLF